MLAAGAIDTVIHNLLVPQKTRHRKQTKKNNNHHFLCEFVAISRYFSVGKQRHSRHRIHWSVSDSATREYRRGIESKRVHKAKMIIYDRIHSCLPLFPRVFRVINRIKFFVPLRQWREFASISKFIEKHTNTIPIGYNAQRIIDSSVWAEGKKTEFSLLYNPTPNSRLIDIDFLISLLCRNTMTTTTMVEVVVNISNTLQCVTSHPI